MKKIFILLLLALSVALKAQYNRELIITDSLFCKMALQKGSRAAFVNYVADSVAVGLKENSYPLTGAEVKKSYEKAFTDTTLVIWWHPLKQWMNSSGDIGYTYGIWKRTRTNDPSFIRQGTYYTLWKKQLDGNWKFIFDTGELGLPEENI